MQDFPQVRQDYSILRSASRRPWQWIAHESRSARGLRSVSGRRPGSGWAKVDEGPADGTSRCKLDADCSIAAAPSRTVEAGAVSEADGNQPVLLGALWPNSADPAATER